MGESQGKVPGGSRRERIQGMSGEGDQPQNSPKGCLDYFLRESFVILASFLSNRVTVYYF